MQGGQGIADEVEVEPDNLAVHLFVIAGRRVAGAAPADPGDDVLPAAGVRPAGPPPAHGASAAGARRGSAAGEGSTLQVRGTHSKACLVAKSILGCDS